MIPCGSPPVKPERITKGLFDKLRGGGYNAAHMSDQAGMATRQRILEHLKRGGPASVGELSRALGLTPVTIRHHLTGLLAGGLIGSPKRRPKPGPGRPEMTYALSAQGETVLPRNLDELCACVVSALAGTLPPAQLQGLMHEAGRRLALREGPRPAARFETRLRQAASFLERRGYFPRWESDDGAYRMTLSHCPYQSLAHDSRAVCAFDQSLIESLLGARVELIGRIVDRQPVCTLRVRPAAVPV